MKPHKLIHPWLFPLFPCLWLYSRNMDFFSLKGLQGTLMASLLIGLTLWGVFALIFRDGVRGAVAATLSLGTMFLFGAFRFPIVEVIDNRTHVLFSIFVSFMAMVIVRATVKLKQQLPLVVSVAFAAFFASEFLLRMVHADSELFLRISWLLWSLGIGVLGAKKAPLQVTSVFLNWVSVFLLLQPISTVVIAIGSQGHETNKSTVSTALGQPKDLPDVYYFILDGYGREDVLREYYGLKQDTLSVALESRGFFVAKNARANYVQTLQSVGATLNMEYLQPEFNANREESSRTSLRKHVEENDVIRQFEKLGYQTIYVATDSNLLPINAEKKLEKRSNRSLLETAILDRTPFFPSDNVSSNGVGHAGLVQAAFSFAKVSVNVSSPKLVIVHVVSPHPPFVFRENGETISDEWRTSDGSHFMQEGGTREEYVQRYGWQVQSVATEMIETLDTIMRFQRGNAFFIIQSDHGPKSRLNYESLAESDLNECLPILCAVGGPQELMSKFYDDMTPVNTFRIVLGHIKNESIPLLQDKSYYTTWDRPYDFIEVTDLVEK